VRRIYVTRFEQFATYFYSQPSDPRWAFLLVAVGDNLRETFMKQEELKIAVGKLEADYDAGKLIMMQTVNRLYDLERDYNLAPEAIAAHITNEDIKDNYRAISRK
jgi:hypothetical protein